MNTETKIEVSVRTLYGLENILKAELNHLGFEDLQVGKRVVTGKATWENIYKANIWSRFGLRILIPIRNFKAKDEEELYNQAKKVKWEDYITIDDSFAVDSTVFSKYFTHSKYVALKVKDAIVDRFREQTGKRPSIDTEYPMMRVHIHINENQATLSLDSSGESLHRRGYRVTKHDAPLNEVLAAGLIKLSGWDGKTDLYDPFCGSGTLLIEACLMANNIPPNKNRSFGFQNWKIYDRELFQKVKKDIPPIPTSSVVNFYGSDISNVCILSTTENVKKAGLENFIDLQSRAFKRTLPPKSPGYVITNPPYGERLVPAEINELYKSIGDTLKKKYAGFNAWILSSNADALKSIGLKACTRIPIFNGALECRFNKYELYEGTKKKESES